MIGSLFYLQIWLITSKCKHIRLQRDKAANTMSARRHSRIVFVFMVLPSSYVVARLLSVEWFKGAWNYFWLFLRKKIRKNLATDFPHKFKPPNGLYCRFSRYCNLKFQKLPIIRPIYCLLASCHGRELQRCESYMGDESSPLRKFLFSRFRSLIEILLR